MIREIGFELIKFKSQRKNYVVMAGHLLFLGLCYLGFKTSKLNFIKHSLNANKFDLNLTDYLDGLFFARAALVPTFVVLMPIFICTLAGGAIAGEIQQGSLKLYASRPRSRSSIVWSKIFAIYGFNLLFCLYLAGAGLLVGLALFGYNPAQLIYARNFGLGNDLSLMSGTEALIRYFATVVYYSFSLMALGSVGLFFSTLFDHPTAATIAAVTVYFVCFIVAQLPFAVEIKPYLLSKVMNGCGVLWLPDIPWYRLGRNLSVLALYSCGFSTLAVCSFNLRDIK
ncbi:MAG: ABC transporter permease [Victivallaceae bacterium]|nr:ABC transporter permease [Victivallaceae bacterium]